MIPTAVWVQGSFAASSSSAADDVLTSTGFATLPACHGGGRWATHLWPSLFFLVAGGQTLFQGLHDIDHGSTRRFRRCGNRLSFLVFEAFYDFGALNETITGRTKERLLKSRMTFVVKLMERDSP
jgi:hypothetical protein